MFHFTKMHGAGNDYVYVNGFEEKLENPAKISEIISDRRFGIGGDGLILILPSAVADFRMQMFNADGSESKMCGNGIRCVGKYVYDKGLTDKTELRIETGAGIKKLSLTTQNSKVTYVHVDMGKAILEPAEIPILSTLERFIAQPMKVGGMDYTVTCVSMGNPHAVIFTSGIDTMELDKIGPLFENHSLFPDRVNAEFIEVIDRKTLRMRVWERGSGETFACGTGTCASVVAAVLNGHCDRDTEVTVHLRGGDLTAIYRSDETVILGGPAVMVFEGTMDL